MAYTDKITIMGQLYYINGNTLIQPNGIKINKRCLRIGVPEKYKLPDIIEIKITNKCVRSCIRCSEKSSEYGENKILPDLYTKLSKLPDYPYVFVISGGCILENLQGFYEVCKFLVDKFSRTTICVKIDLMDIVRINNLPISFGKYLTNAFLDYPGFYCVSLNNINCCEVSELHNLVSKVDKYNFSWGRNTVFMFDHTTVPFEMIIKLMEDRSTKESMIVEGGFNYYNNRDKIHKYIEEQRLHCVKPKLWFDQDAYSQLCLDKFLLPTEKSIYSLGWDNYIYIDSVSGMYRKSRLGENTSWDNLEILDYYGGKNTSDK